MTIRPDRRSLIAQQQPELTFQVVNSTPHAVGALGGDAAHIPLSDVALAPLFFHSHSSDHAVFPQFSGDF